MSKIEDKLFQFDRIKRKKHKYIIPLIIILLLIISVTLIIVFKGRDITDSIGITKSEEEKQAEQIEENLDSDKTYDRESGLIVPTFNSSSIINDKINYISITGKDIKASSKGYTLTFEFSSLLNRYLAVDFLGVYIDGYETDVKLDSLKLSSEPVTVEFTIKKTKLDLIEIKDFNEIIFNMKIQVSKTSTFDNITETKYISENIKTHQITEVSNTIRNKVLLDDIGSVKIYYHKMDDDNDNYYIYFIFEETNGKDLNHVININKLLINGEVFDYKMETTLRTASTDVKYITISKKDIKSIDSMNISFIIRNYTYDNPNDLAGIYYSRLREVNT